MLRITGGTLRGRRIATPKGRMTRPTAEKVREGIFNTLGSLVDLEGAVVLDLYAGSGALGIEALSRGAGQVVFLEAHARTAAAIRANLKSLGVPPSQWRVITARVESWLGKPQIPEGVLVILADPPYASGEAERALEALARATAVPSGTNIVLEAAARSAPELPAGLEILRVKRYGDTQVVYLAKTEIPALHSVEGTPS
ncbi:MAG: 16S rRNA (guanine(966)-N(2))-methyltransferase RsmD [SAR324 cluster bacterium]|nr:16S rRNA (guanine(966)-N(2))-methyltransferase RsmD [SAR324 cluster bacterium]